MHSLIQSLTCPNAVFIYFSWIASAIAFVIAARRYQG